MDNSTSSIYGYDVMDRVTSITHALVGATRTFDYGYDVVGNRDWAKRDGNLGDVYDYDKNDQAITTKLNIANPDTTAPGPQTIVYDANGNRTSFAPPYTAPETYGPVNALNQYTTRNGAAATYDANGNMTRGFDGSTYTYDAQNRLLSATKGGTTDTFLYDGLNRQIGKRIGSQALYYRVYDGWDLVGEYKTGTTNAIFAYLYGPGGIVKNVVTNYYYYQDASGSTSHVADITGALKEYYRYDLHGTPLFFNASGAPRSDTAIGVRHLFTGQQWYNELGLYDLRNRYYSPDIGRFLQTDPIGFGGDITNLYRYCGNNSIVAADPTGLGTFSLTVSGNTVNITLPIHYSNPFSGTPVSPQIAQTFNQGIVQYWGGDTTGGRYNVDVQVIDSYGNAITVYPGSATFVTRSDGTGDWYIRGTGYDSPGYAAAHEAGHLMNLNMGSANEGYQLVNGQRVSKQGYADSIMGGGSNVHASDQDVENVIASYTPPPFWSRVGTSILNFLSRISGGTASNLGGAPPAAIAHTLTGEPVYEGHVVVPFDSGTMNIESYLESGGDPFAGGFPDPGSGLGAAGSSGGAPYNPFLPRMEL